MQLILKRFFSALDATSTLRLFITTLTFVSTALCLLIAAAHEDTRIEQVNVGMRAQAIERGAEIYAQYCADCHGRSGYGIVGRAPALNNPQLFGHDYLPEITGQLRILRDKQRNLQEEWRNLSIAEQSQSVTTDQLQKLDNQIADLNAEENQRLKPAVDFGYKPEQYNRLAQVGWKSDLQSFVLTSIIHGRPVSSSYWPQAMPAYSEEASTGVVLDLYQLKDVVAYILNWDKGDGWTLDDLYAVNQFAILPIDPWCCRDLPPIPLALLSKPVGTDVKAIVNDLKMVTGDAKRGEQLYHGQERATLTAQALPCIGCHQQDADSIGPMTDKTYTRIINERLKQPQFAGFTPEEYLIDSIVNPSHYIVPGFKDLMVKNLGTDILDIQDLADIVAYLMTQK